MDKISARLYLDRLLVQILLLAGDEVGSHDPALLTSGNNTGEDTAKSVESSLVGGRHHLRDVHHQGSGGVTVLDAHAGKIVRGSLVQKLGSLKLKCSDKIFIVKRVL